MRLSDFFGQSNTLVLNVHLVDLCDGDYGTALLLSQLIYWTGKSQDGWVYKSSKDWYDEIRLSEWGLRKAKTFLVEKGLIETKVKKANGNPTTHYRVNFAKLKEFLRLDEICADSPNDSVEGIKNDSENSTGLNLRNSQERTREILKNEPEKFSESSIQRLHTETTSEITTESIVAAPSTEGAEHEKSPAYEFYLLFAEEYEKLYNIKPLRNAKTMGQAKQIAKNLPRTEWAEVVRAFLGCREAFVVKRAHDIGLLLSDLQKYRVMASAGIKVIPATQIERKTALDETFERAEKILKEGGWKW